MTVKKRIGAGFKPKHQGAQFKHEASPVGRSTAFKFGDAESVLGNNVSDFLGLFIHGSFDYYEPPLDQKGLLNLLGANAHHGTLPYFHMNMLAKWYQETPLISRQDLARAGFDYKVLGHCYFQAVRKKYGSKAIVRYLHLPGVDMRKHKKPDVYCKLRKNETEPLEYKKGEVIQLKNYDPKQPVYGCPEYWGGINSILLNEEATLFRRKYYVNGAHMGYIFYTADAAFDEADEKALKDQIANSKGVGNFRSMFLNIPGGKPDSVQIIPVGDISQKDEFNRIKEITQKEVLAMWRTRPELAGIMPDTAGGTGDLNTISQINYENEVVPFQQVFLALNNGLAEGVKPLAFEVPEFKQNAAS